MIHIIRDLDSRYERTAPFPWQMSFSALCEAVSPRDDDELADLVDRYGRDRIERDLPLDLQMFLDSIHNLAGRRVVLDAAIDMVLRSLSGAELLSMDAVETLQFNYPHLRAAILDAVHLHFALVSTTGAPSALQLGEPFKLPMRFGPALPDGQLQYELTELIGEGACAQMYLAIDHGLSDPDAPAYVAVKVLRVGVLDDDAVRLFAEEATKARRVNHPSVAAALRRGVTAEGHSFIVYEYIPGANLELWATARKEPCGAREAARITAKIARGIQSAHFAGVVHCDLKPRNVVMSSDGDPKIVDFGISQRIRTNETSMNSVRSGRLGTLGFMAPEQYAEEISQNAPPVDTYAIGGILYWMITGKAPNGVSASDVARRMHEPQVVTRAELDLIDEPVIRRVIERCLQREPSDRYPSPSEIADDLEAYLQHRPIRWMRPSLAARALLFARRRPGLFVSAALLAISLGVIALVQRQAVSSAAEAREAKKESTEVLGRNQMVLESLKQAKQKNSAAAKAGRLLEVLEFVWVTDYLSGRGVYSDPSAADRLWECRIEAYESRIQRWRDAGLPDDLYLLLLELQLGYWLYHDEHLDRALVCLAGLPGRFEKLGAGGQLLTIQSEVLLACAAAEETECHPVEPWTVQQLDTLLTHIDSKLCRMADFGERGNLNDTVEQVALEVEMRRANTE